MKKTFISIVTIFALAASGAFSQENTVSAAKEAQIAETQSVSMEAGQSENTASPIGLELYTGYGYLTANTLIVGFTSIFGEIISGTVKAMAEANSEKKEGEEKKEEEKSAFNDYGVFSLGANWHFTDNLYAGLSGTFQPFQIFDGDPLNIVSFLANFGVEYGWEKAKFYHEIGAGVVLFTSPDEVSPMFAMNLTAFGFKFNPVSNLWLFTDLNFGQKGLVNAGVSWKL